MLWHDVRRWTFVSTAGLGMLAVFQFAQGDPGSTPPGPAAKKSAKNPDAKLYDSGYLEDNETCMVCHLDFKRELIAATHLEAGITCAGCHGDSEVHSSDELNVIRPDVIWGRSEIDAFCKQCHPAHKDDKNVAAFHQEWDGKRRPNGRFVRKNSVCTDCHGRHAIVKSEGDFK